MSLVEDLEILYILVEELESFHNKYLFLLPTHNCKR